MRSQRVGLLASALCLAGCASRVPSAAPAAETREAEWRVPEEVLDPRMATFSCVEDPGRPARTLDLWLDLLGERVVRERGEGFARIRTDVLRGEDYPDRDQVLRWRSSNGGLEVQVSCPKGIGGDWSRLCLGSLEFAMEAKGIECEPAPPSGCAPPDDLPHGAPTWREAVDAAFGELDLVFLREDVEQGANVSFYGPPGGAPEWHVDAELDRSPPTLEVFHDAKPFDARGERDLLCRILRRLGTVPWGLFPDGPIPSAYEGAWRP